MKNGCKMCRYGLADTRTRPRGNDYYCTNEDSPRFGEKAEGGCKHYHRFNARPDMSFKDALDMIIMCPKGAYTYQFFKFGDEGEAKRPFACISFESNKQMHDWREAHMRCFDELMRLKEEAGDFKTDHEVDK